ncbi:MAG: ferrochelatase [candidate division Zixibacteria bacterium]
MKQALLMVNMGGPRDLSEVPGYLRAIFNDPAILPLPGFLRKPLASYIISKRKEKVADRYKLIGGSSPLLEWTKKLADLVRSAVNKSGKKLDVSFAFRYTSPTIEEALNNLADQNIEKIILLPLFPHRTGAMSGSIEKEASRVAGKLNLKLKNVPAWGNNERFLAILEDYLKESLSEKREYAHVLFVAHGIPARNVRNGDDYPDQVNHTAKSLGNSIPENIGWSLAYQSRVGPLKWIGPSLDSEIDRISATGVDLHLMPLSFVADCLETLYDLDIIASEQAKNKGAKSVNRIRVFNDDPEFAEALTEMVLEEYYNE